MKDSSVYSFEEMDLAIKNEDFNRASKYVIVQLETIIAYLIIDFDLINEIIKKPELNSIYKLNGDANKGYYLSVDDKIRLAVNYCGATDVDVSMVNVVKSVRDFYSHGYHESDLKSKQRLADKILNDHSRYFKECFKLIKAIRIKLYAQFQPKQLNASKAAPAEAAPAEAAPAEAAPAEAAPAEAAPAKKKSAQVKVNGRNGKKSNRKGKK